MSSPPPPPPIVVPSALLMFLFPGPPLSEAVPPKPRRDFNLSIVDFLQTSTRNMRIPAAMESKLIGTGKYGEVQVDVIPVIRCLGVVICTGRMEWMAHRKWKEIKQQSSMLPGSAVPGYSVVSFHFLWAILCPQAVFGFLATWHV